MGEGKALFWDRVEAASVEGSSIRNSNSYLNETWAPELAGLVRRLRSEIGQYQAEVAPRMMTAQSNVARLESGNSIPSIKTLVRFAESIGRSLVIAIVTEDEFTESTLLDLGKNGRIAVGPNTYLAITTAKEDTSKGNALEFTDDSRYKLGDPELEFESPPRARMTGKSAREEIGWIKTGPQVKRSLVEEISEMSGLGVRSVAKVISSLENVIASNVAHGDRVELTGFLAFENEIARDSARKDSLPVETSLDDDENMLIVSLDQTFLDALESDS